MQLNVISSSAQQLDCGQTTSAASPRAASMTESSGDCPNLAAKRGIDNHADAGDHHSGQGQHRGEGIEIWPRL